MWTPENRPRYNRDKLRYPSDLTDDEWSCINLSIPPAKSGGRPRKIDLREVLNGIVYVLSTGVQWRYISQDLPPRSTLHGYFRRWNDDTTPGTIHHTLYVACREQIGRKTSLTACVIDGQSVKGAEKGGRVDPNGYDAGKKVKGKKRHISVDTARLLLHAIVRPADIQDRDGGVPVMSSRFGLFPFLRKLFADAGSQGPPSAAGTAEVWHDLAIEVVRRSDTAKGFKLLPRRWVVERTFAWLNRCRRLAKDFENRTRNALAFSMLAPVRLMLRKLCNSR